ncbi:MAG: adenylyl-sulfate kinase [Lysobacteraceae bacterium]
MDRLRFITCGSVDDGKSTLIGRLLHDTREASDDQMAALARDSAKHGTQGEALDFALLVDGLAAEREQGITIDVAYRYFSTPKRHFIVADCPGHEQYTRNMATGASTADLAIVLVDARKGVLPQTRRHSWICTLLGVRQVVLAVNKMDLVGWEQGVFDSIRAEYDALAEAVGIERVQAVPVSALAGDNLTRRGGASWYVGPTLLEHLESAPIPPLDADGPLRLPVQLVLRPDSSFRGYAGTVAHGRVAPGDAVRVQPSNVEARIERVLLGGREVDRAEAGQAAVVTLDRERDVSRGDVLSAAEAPLPVSDQFAAHVVWMDEAPLVPGRGYWLRIGTREVAATVTEISHRIDDNPQAHEVAKQLAMNDVGLVKLSLAAPIPLATYAESRALGGFILVDRLTNATAGAGVVRHGLRRGENVHWQAFTVDKAVRAAQKQQTPRCVWFTGLSGSGKSTIANLVERGLVAQGRHTYVLDGDNVRHGLNRDLGFTEADRVENLRRVAEVAKLMVDAGLVVLISFIAPYAREREMARSLFAPGEFLEVFVDTPIEVCESRDPKGLYAKARAGKIPNFTGINAPYERPVTPDLRLDTTADPPDALAQRVIDAIGG